MVVCILNAESTSTPEDLHVPPDTGSGQTGIAQWDEGAWTKDDGEKYASTPLGASPIQQLAILVQAIKDGYSGDWTPYDHC
jgi:Transglycosylase-like domain